MEETRAVDQLIEGWSKGREPREAGPLGDAAGDRRWWSRVQVVNRSFQMGVWIWMIREGDGMESQYLYGSRKKDLKEGIEEIEEGEEERRRGINK